eukprot:s2893_g3.t1
MGMSMRKAAAIGVGHGAKQAPVAEPIMLLKLEEALATWLQALGCVRLVHVQRSRLVPDEDDASVSRGWHSHRMQLKLNMHALAIPRSTPMDPFQAESETAEPYWHSAAKLTSELAEGSRLSYIENLDRAERGEWAMMRDSRCHPATHSSAEARAPASEQASGSYVAKYAQELRDGTISFAPASSKESAGGQAPNWPTRARLVVEKVSAYFAIFYVCYITIIVFAVIRVISAIFLKDTLDAAHSDADNLVAENLAKKAEYVKKLESFFKAIDEFGDGLITEERLTDILSNPKVAAYFATLDVDVPLGAESYARV